jgi:DNA helicase-2/ATP-dependent DNA helicase PcrA
VPAVTTDLADELQADWLARRAVVIELTPGIGLDDPAVPPPERITDLQPWDWPVDLDLRAERLHHAIWANAVDAREPHHLRWRWAEQAQAAGAVRPGPGGDGDLLLPDGRPVLCDGGPLDAGIGGELGMDVLHRISIEHGSLQPLSPAGPPAGPLAPDQLAAVTERRAGARVIAPAGSGKTRVLTERARLLLRGWGLPAGALALVAYNVRAAHQMRDRLADVDGLRIRTLNALGLRLCGRSATIEEIEVRRILSGLVSFPRRAETDPAAPWIEALSRLRLGLAEPDAVEEEVGDVSGLAEVARSFRAELAGRDVVDFDEQVVGAIERLLADPAFRARSQRFARVLLVDEFQDLTPAHLLLIRLLSGPAGSVFGVGDDDQTIYGYAGATPRWLVDFGRWFPGSASHSLEVNYRCPPAVVTAASNLLSRNSVRVAKTIRAAAAGVEPEAGRLPEGELIVRRSGQSGRPGPAGATADRVGELLEAGVRPTDVAVLSRVNASLVPVQVVLGHRGLPVTTGADRRFLQRSGVRAALAWLEVASAPATRLPGPALREAARRPKRGMSHGLLELLSRPRAMGSLEGLSVWLQAKGEDRDAAKVDQFVTDVETVRRAATKGTADVLRAVRRRVGAGGLDASAEALDRWSHGAIAAHADDLDALTELAGLEPDPERFPSWLADRLAAPDAPEGVLLASIHSVKGREWPHVVLHHVTEGLLPHRLAGDHEEERRIFHVGLTRCIRSVTVVAGEPPSPFLAELDRPGRPDTATRPGGTTATGSHRPAAAPGPSTGPGRSAAPGSTKRPGGGRRSPAELLPAAPGLVFSTGGQEHTVVEMAGDHVMCLLGGGPARTRIRYGTEVFHAGRSVVVAHPAAEPAGARLRAWRTEKARTMAVPAYVVFDDSTLSAVAAVLPITEAGLAAIRGIGPTKLDSYGAELMAMGEELRAGLAASADS